MGSGGDGHAQRLRRRCGIVCLGDRPYITATPSAPVAVTSAAFPGLIPPTPRYLDVALAG